MNCTVNENNRWVYYSAEDTSRLDNSKVGKWMYRFNDYNQAEYLCLKAIRNNVVVTAKHTNVITNEEIGIACFYINIDDIAGHKKVIEYFLKNDMIRKTKNGKFYNISFKLDNQTRAGKYGKNFKSKLTLSELMDLKTGEWIV